MPKIHRKPLPPGERLCPLTQIRTLGRSPVLDALSGIELVVYLRLLAADHEQNDSAGVKVENADLYREPRTAGRALAALEELKLIRIVRKDGESRRIVLL